MLSSLLNYFPNKARNTPAATADPITPATLGPIACISKKFDGFAFWPSTWDTLAAIGTAETPAEPIRGLILPPDIQHISFPISNPPTVLNMNANNPRPIIPSVWGRKKTSPFAVAPTVTPRKIVTIFIKAF